MSTEKKGDFKRLGTPVAAALLSCFLLIMVIISIFYIISPGIYYSRSRPEILLTLIVIAGVVGLLASLAVVTVITNFLDLSNPKEALGLPKGSVRALIALSLIVIFSIMSLYLYGQLAGTPSEEQTRFAQQILTTVSTLVVAVAAFYFGTKSVEVAKEAVAKPKLKISPSGQVELDIKKDEDREQLIEVETMPEDEKITWEIAGDKSGTLVQIEPNKFKYTASKNLLDGTIVTLTFASAKYGDVSKKLKVRIKNK